MEARDAGSTVDFDGAWKEALDEYLEPFLRLCFPIVHDGIDWEQGALPLDKELQAVVRDAETGKSQVDKLFKVIRRDGAEEWLLIHIEIQSQPDRRLPERMYRYYHRIADRYNQRVVSLAVLADNVRLYERGYAKEDILKLYRLIDWLIQLPEELAVEFQQELVEYEAQKHMPYITSIERLGLEKGRREGLTAARQKAVVDALEIRFGQVPDAVHQAIETIHNEIRLRTLHQAAIQTVSIEDFAREL